MNISGVIDTLNARLAIVYRLCSRIAYAPAIKETRPQQLRRGEVLRLAGGARRLEIQQGTIWLTTTPAQGDVLLQSGDSFELTYGSCVVESLEDAEISLH